ncbi:MAG: hypothetical protein ACLT8E_06305 [Akkermansia sp.]
MKRPWPPGRRFARGTEGGNLTSHAHYIQSAAVVMDNATGASSPSSADGMRRNPS